ncbi:partial Dipeptidyl-peptidase 5, partial [Anaerolineae bacterium]
DTPTTHIYLEGGVYAFSFPGSASQPQFPLMAGRMVIHGNEATIRLENYAPEMVITVDAGAEVTFEQVTLQFESPQGRSILNRGKLSLIDSSLINDSGAPAYTQGEGGGIENRGELHLTRVRLRGLRVVSSSDPGGAITNAGTLGASCVHFAHNRASQGGAVYNAPGGSAQISLSVFEGNRANGGGAIYNAEGNADLEATHNFWGGGEPGIDDWMWGMDTISGRVLYAPVLASDPLTSPECAVPPEQTPTAPAGGTGNPPSPASVVLPVPLVNAPLAFMSDFYKLTIGVVEPGGVYRSEPWADGAVLDTPVWSPDGRRVAYASIRSGNAEVYILDLISHQEINVSQTLTHYDTQPVWSADGSKLAFASRQRASGQSSRLIVVDKDGTNAQILPLRPAEAGYASSPSSPSWAPDGNRLFFIASSYLFWIETTFPDVPHQVSIFHPTLGYPLYVDGVAHAPQGAQILLSAAYWGGGGFAPPGYNLFLANEDGSGVQQGAYLSDPLYPAVWSPDGSQIVFRKRVNTQENLYLLNRAAFGLSNGSLLATQVFGGGVWRVSLAQATPTPTLSSTLITVYTNCRVLNLRDAPNGQIIGEIPSGVQIHLDESSKTGPLNNAFWYRIRVEGIQNPQGTPMPVAEGWIATKLGDDYLLFDYDRSPNCTPTPPVTVTATPTLSATPTACKLNLPDDEPSQPIHLFRAPIRGNPAEWKKDIHNELLIDAYAIDPLNHRLWFRRTEGVPQAPNGFILRWFQVIEPNAGFILSQQDIIVPKGDFDGVSSLSVERSQIEACLSTLSNANLSGHYALPSLDQVPWELTSPLTFSHYPVSMYQTCVDGGVKEVFGFADTDYDFYYAPGYHFGVDFFAPPGSTVFAGANRGLVVALLHNEATTGAYWGNYAVTETPNHDKDLTPYAVVIRYGHLFVLYGHLEYIDPDIWVGKQVSAGDPLGKLGTFATPHLHINVMSFGRTPPDAYITWAQEIDPQNPQAPRANRWGIPDFERIPPINNRPTPIGRPNHVYDFTQFYGADPILLATFQATAGVTGTPNTLEQPIHQATVWAEDNANTGLKVQGLGGTHRTVLRLGFPCELPYSQSFPEPIGWRYVNPLITPTVLPRHRSFIYYPGRKDNWTPAPADDPRVAIPPPNLTPLPTLTPTATP